MIDPLTFCTRLNDYIDFYTGVPDSLLQDFCACLSNTKTSDYHIIAANEGNAVALAAGHYLGSGKPACVYMQNSGLGNAVNPLLSLMDKAVYRMPLLIIIGWRGEPGVKDEPQHVTQGELTLPLLETMGIPYKVIDKNTSLNEILLQVKEGLAQEIPYAVVRKGTFSKCPLEKPVPDISAFKREEAITTILENIPSEYRIVSTTGKISRELFELRELRNEDHDKDFLVVGSMGHTSQIALGVALAQPDTPVCCLDGDGSVLMHMGSFAVNAGHPGRKLLHIVLNNAAHDTVGGQPTAAGSIDLPAMAKAAGYPAVYSCSDKESLRAVLQTVYSNVDRLTLVEVKVAKGSRDDLGRPTVSALDGRLAFQKSLLPEGSAP